MKKLIRFIAWVFVAVVAVIASALIALSIWAATGNRDLTHYNEKIEASINKALVGKQLAIGKTYLEWNHIDDLLTLKAEKVELYDRDNNLIADFPRIILKYDIFSLMLGNFIPSGLYLVAPVVDLTNLTHKGDDKGLDFQDFNLGKLREVTILNGVLKTPDASEWQINRARLTYKGDIIMDANISRQDGQQVIASLRTNHDQSDSFMRMQFKNFDSDSLLYYIPEIKNKRFIANGSGVYTSNQKGRFIDFKIDEMVGAIDDPAVFTEKLTIKAGVAEGVYDIDNEILDIKNFTTSFDDDLTLTGKAVITTFNTFFTDIDFTNLKVMNFKKYWPIVVAPNAISWIKEHMSDGVVTAGKINLKLSPEEIETGVLADDAIDIKFQFKDVATSYLPNLPVITKGSGTGVVNGTAVKLNVDNAIAGKSTISRAVLDFYDFDKDTSYLNADVDINGAAADMADFYIQLGSGKKLLGSKDNISGNAVGNVKLNLPLNSDLKISEVKYKVKAQINEGGVKNLLDSFDATAATLNVEADQNSYAVSGQSYATYNKSGDFTLTNAPISFEVASKGGGVRIAVASDITNSAAKFAPLELEKKAGEAGKFVVEIIDNGQVVKLNKVMLDSEAIRLNAKGSLKKDYSNLSSLEFAAQFGKSDITGKLSNNKFLAIDLKSPFVDAAPLIRYMKNDDEEDDDTEFRLRLKADKVGLMNGRELKNVFVNMHCTKDCDTISLNSEKLSFVQTSANLTVKLANAGAVLDGFDLYNNMVGGTLDINAKVSGDNYDGRVTITDFSIVKAQILAKMLSLGSLTGIADALSGKGIGFKKLASDFEFTKKKIIIKDFRMVGSAIGLTANGEIIRANDDADISGNIIPAYTANTLLGRIPLLGDVIIGDDGVFALAYSLKGNMDDPDLSVNPLSVLAPGFLKNLFQ